MVGSIFAYCSFDHIIYIWSIILIYFPSLLPRFACYDTDSAVEVINVCELKLLWSWRGSRLAEARKQRASRPSLFLARMWCVCFICSERTNEGNDYDHPRSQVHQSLAVKYPTCISITVCSQSSEQTPIAIFLLSRYLIDHLITKVDHNITWSCFLAFSR